MRQMVRRTSAQVLLAAVTTCIAVLPAQAAPKRSLYATSSATCGGYPRPKIDMATGFCAGLVVGPTSQVFAQRTLKLPRTLTPLG